MATSVRLDPAVEQRLDHLAAKTGRTKAYYLRELIEGGLNDLEDYYLRGQVAGLQKQAADLLHALEARQNTQGDVPAETAPAGKAARTKATKKGE